MTYPQSALMTDLYQLTMMQGYYLSHLRGKKAVYDMFIRKNPFEGGYTIFAGIEDAIEFLENVHFFPEDLDYLDSLGIFHKEFIDHLKDFRFRGDVYAMAEGSVVFPYEPLVRVHGSIEECQLIETALLNIVNFQSLVATKSARVCLEAGEDNVIEFGLRRAQGPDGGITASRAAYVGGCAATSNVIAGKIYGIPVKGTHAHAWVTAFPDELAAFRKYAEIFPAASILLVDTFDTLKSGLPNAIQTALELRKNGQELLGIRLDSGDLAYLSIEARRMLDDAGLENVKIVASNELDEYVVRELKRQGAKIDFFGVGTKLVTAKGDPALSGVYKMAAVEGDDGKWESKMKLSETTGKSTLPGLKQVYRLIGSDGNFMGDLIELADSHPDFQAGILGVHPFMEYHSRIYGGIDEARPMLRPVMGDGKRLYPVPPLEESRQRVKKELSGLHPGHLRLLNPHVYKVSLGPDLAAHTRELREKVRGIRSGGE